MKYRSWFSFIRRVNVYFHSFNLFLSLSYSKIFERFSNKQTKTTKTINDVKNRWIESENWTTMIWVTICAIIVKIWKSKEMSANERKDNVDAFDEMNEISLMIRKVSFWICNSLNLYKTTIELLITCWANFSTFNKVSKMSSNCFIELRREWYLNEKITRLDCDAIKALQKF